MEEFLRGGDVTMEFSQAGGPENMPDILAAARSGGEVKRVSGPAASGGGSAWTPGLKI